jgi:hypothetical protein
MRTELLKKLAQIGPHNGGGVWTRHLYDGYVCGQLNPGWPGEWPGSRMATICHMHLSLMQFAGAVLQGAHPKHLLGQVPGGCHMNENGIFDQTT